MNKLSTIVLASLTGAVTLLGAIKPANAYVIFFGEDLSPDPSDPATFINSNDMQDLFLSGLIGVGTETFEGLATGTPAPISLTFPGAGTATLSGGGTVVSSGNGGAGRFPISPTQYIQTSAGSAGNFKVDFSAPIGAFGFYGTDIGDFGGQLTLKLTNGGTTSLTVPNTIGSGGSTNGSVLYYGFYAENITEEVTGIEFLNSSTEDVFGFDNLTVGSLQQINPPDPGPGVTTPEPTSVLGLLTVGMFGLGALKRRQG